MFFKVFKREIAKIVFFTFLVGNRKSARAPHLTAIQQPFDAHCITIIYIPIFHPSDVLSFDA